MEPCKETPHKLETNGDIALGYRIIRNDLGVCNADKAALKEWAVGNKLIPVEVSNTP